MELTGILANLVRQTYAGEVWHGPSLADALDGVGADRAAARPIGSAHSIAEIVAHVSGWSDVVRRRLDGEADAKPEGEDFSGEAATDEAWAASVRKLLDRGAELATAIANLDGRTATEAQLGDAIGALHHAIYHAGQISVLRKG